MARRLEDLPLEVSYRTPSPIVDPLFPIADRLTYRGYDVNDLIAEATFEEVAYLLLKGRWPDRQQCHAFTAAWRRPTAQCEDRGYSQPTSDAFDAFYLACHEAVSNQHLPSSDPVLSLKSLLQSGLNKGEFCNTDRHPLPWAHQTLSRLRPTKHPVSASALKVTNALMIAHMDHAHSPSAQAVTDSVRLGLTPIHAFQAGLKQLKNSFQGQCFQQLDEALEASTNSASAEAWVLALRQNGERLSGFGHKRYRRQDPRAEALKQVLFSLQGERAATLQMATEHLESAIWDHCKAFPNAAFYAIALLKWLGVPVLHYPWLFALSRSVGLWAKANQASPEDTLQSCGNTQMGKCCPRETELELLMF